MDEAAARIKEYLTILDVDTSDDALIDFVISEVIDRAQLYLNCNEIPQKIERILANIVNDGLNKSKTRVADNSITAGQAITSLSDNGQTISFANEAKNYFATVSDNELFSGFATLLARYRRVKVVNS